MFLSRLKIYDFDEISKCRIGNQGDGGYVVAWELCEKTDVLYSFGIGDDISFESEFAERFQCDEINLIDGTIRNLPRVHRKFKWKQENVHRNLDQIISYNGNNALLKMDIEWGEWTALYSANRDTFQKFNQLIIEFHIVHIPDVPKEQYSHYFNEFYQSIYNKINRNIFRQYFLVMCKLLDLFYIFHIHANNSLPKISISGHSFPPLLEISFIRKDLISSIPKLSQEKYPINGIDYPNKNDRPDIEKVYPF